MNTYYQLGVSRGWSKSLLHPNWFRIVKNPTLTFFKVSLRQPVSWFGRQTNALFSLFLFYFSFLTRKMMIPPTWDDSGQQQRIGERDGDSRESSAGWDHYYGSLRFNLHGDLKDKKI